MSLDVVLAGDHPLCLELASLREAVNHFQGLAHRATVQLRHQCLEHATLLQHLHALENENSYLQTELHVHRVAGPADTHRDSLQIQELTLALRRLSDKLDLTEKVLLERNEDVISAQSQCIATKKAEENATAAVKRLQLELAAGHGRERELMNSFKASEEQRKLSDLVVEEYANLVRSLEGRPSLSSQRNGKANEDRSRRSLDGLVHARQGLHKLLQDSNYDSEKLHAEINHLHDALESARADLETERATAQEDRRRLAQAQLELHQLKSDDNAAAKMVSRYMKFSQSSADILHGAIEKLKVRQEAIISSYESRLRQAEERIASETRQCEMLRRALDELTEDISRESYGRRREIVLRLTLLAREEMLSERLRRWLHRSHEVVHKARSRGDGNDLPAVYERILNDAQVIQSRIDSPPVLGAESMSSVARVYAAHATVKALQEELRRETDRRLYFEFQLASSRPQRAQTIVPVTKMLGTNPSASVESPILSDSASAAVSRSELHSDIIPEVTHVDLDVRNQPGSASVSSSKLDLPLEFSETAPASDQEFSLHISIANSTQNNTAEQEFEYDSYSTAALPNGDKEAPLLSVTETASDSSAPVATHQADQFEVGDSGETVLGAPDASTEDTETKPSTKDIGTGKQHLAASSIPSLDASNAPESSDITTSPREMAAVDTARTLNSQESIENAPTRDPSVDPLLPMPQSERYRIPVPNQRMESRDFRSAAKSLDEKDVNVANLLSKLVDVDERYVDLQRSFRDCHLALQELRQSSEDAPNPSLLQAAIERLNDYCEDARVELEIRIADEERIAKGFQTLLSVPGALPDEVNEQEVMRQIETFVDGSDPAVRRAQDMLKHKLDDLEHDIASVKRGLHTIPNSPLLSPQDLQEQAKVSGSGWASWTGSILGSSRTSSPAPSFGAVMTSPRLRHSSSTRSLRVESSDAHGPFSSLGLRIAMPSSIQHQREQPTSPMVKRGSARPHIPSSVFGLGFRAGLSQGMPKPSLGFKFDNVSKYNSEKSTKELDNDIE